MNCSRARDLCVTNSFLSSRKLVADRTDESWLLKLYIGLDVISNRSLFIRLNFKESRIKSRQNSRASHIRDSIYLQVFGVRVGDLHVRRMCC